MPIMSLMRTSRFTSHPDDGTTAADQTFKALIDAITELSGVKYAWLDIAPSNNKDGGQPGGSLCSVIVSAIGPEQMHF